jgi:hypothetical protein
VLRGTGCSVRRLCSALVVSITRGLGLTPSEIQEPAGSYLGHPDEPIGPRLAQALRAVSTRPERRIEELRALIQRIAAHEATMRTSCSVVPTSAPEIARRPQGLTLPVGGDP